MIEPRRADLDDLVSSLSNLIEDAIEPYDFCLFVFSADNRGGWSNFASAADRKILLTILKKAVALIEMQLDEPRTMQ